MEWLEIKDVNESWYTVDELIKKHLWDRRLNKSELLEIQETYQKEKPSIWNETKAKIETFIRDMYIEMLKNWMSIDYEKDFGDLKKLLESYGYTISIDFDLANDIKLVKTSNKNLWKININWNFKWNTITIWKESSFISRMNNDYVIFGWEDVEFLDKNIKKDTETIITKSKLEVQKSLGETKKAKDIITEFVNAEKSKKTKEKLEKMTIDILSIVEIAENAYNTLSKPNITIKQAEEILNIAKKSELEAKDFVELAKKEVENCDSDEKSDLSKKWVKKIQDLDELIKKSIKNCSLNAVD